MAEDAYDNYFKWYRWAYEKTYGKGSWNEGISIDKNAEKFGFREYSKPFKAYWNDELGVGVLEKDGKFVGIACLVAKEITDSESFKRKFGLTFDKDIQWKAVSGLLDHLSRSPIFKAVLVTMSKVPFKLEPDIPEDLEGRLRWAKRNYEFHRSKADNLKRDLEAQAEAHLPGGPFPSFLPKQMKEEENHARKFLEVVKSLESQIQESLRNFFIIKDNLFCVALFFYVYTNPQESFEQALNEIISRKRSAKIEANLTYFVKCSDVKDPLIVFNPEFFPLWNEVKKYYGVALSQDCAGFGSDKDVASALRKMFIMALEVPKEVEIKEEIHVPEEEVSVELPRRAFIGYVVESIIKNKVKKRKVFFPLDVLTSHCIIFGKTRVGKSFLALIIVNEALKNGIKVKVFDPHGTLANALRRNENLEVNFTGGRADITDKLKEIYEEASKWPETNELKLLVVLDETRLLKAKNLVYCINELGKRGVGFILITQYSTSIPPEVRNVGTYFIMSAMSETEIQRFKEITLHPSSKLITRLPKAVSYVFSPYWYPEPFFIRHKKVNIVDLSFKKREQLENKYISKLSH